MPGYPHNPGCTGPDYSGAPTLKDRLFIGMFPAALVYADRGIEEHGDYRRLASLSYDTLELSINDPRSALIPLVIEHARRYQARRGERISIAGNMTALLGRTLKTDDPIPPDREWLDRYTRERYARADQLKQTRRRSAQPRRRKIAP